MPQPSFKEVDKALIPWRAWWSFSGWRGLGWSCYCVMSACLLCFRYWLDISPLWTPARNALVRSAVWDNYYGLLRILTLPSFSGILRLSFFLVVLRIGPFLSTWLANPLLVDFLSKISLSAIVLPYAASSLWSSYSDIGSSFPDSHSSG
jgi:hypothetical protein